MLKKYQKPIQLHGKKINHDLFALIVISTVDIMQEAPIIEYISGFLPSIRMSNRYPNKILA